MKTMQKLMGVLVLIVLVSLVASSASAQNIAVQFDEYGNGFANNVPLPHSIALDTVSGFSTLMYELPFRVTPGDLFITEGPAPSAPSDLVRFENITNTSGVVLDVAYFFSDPADETPIPLADNSFGIPQPSPLLNAISVAEVGTEGSNGVVYIPNAGDPGSNPTQVTYNIVSDGTVVPEPSTLVMLGMSTIGLLAFAWRKRK